MKKRQNNIKMTKYLLLILFLFQISFSRASDSNAVTFQGYIIYVGGEIYFSPVGTRNDVSLQRALNEKAFF